MPLPTDVRVRDVSFATEEYRYRTPLKFGGVACTEVTLLNAEVTVETQAGRTARGFGSMPLGNVWAFPSRTLTYDQTLAALKDAATRVAKSLAGYTGVGHPIDAAHDLEPEWLAAAGRAGGEPVPPLAVLVAASPFDAALHDAFGKAHGLNVYRTYTREFLPRDLSHYLGAEFAGLHLSQFVSTTPKPRMPLYHLVGALDPLTPADVREPVGDGLPETLGDWVRADGLTHLKVKLNGDDLAWDVDRVVSVDRVTAEVQRERGVAEWCYSLDFNERCPDAAYLLGFIEQLKAKAPAAWGRVQYVEQPTRRDLRAEPRNPMHEASKHIPVVIDESLLGLESLHDARSLGYTGAALKACKGQSQSLLMAAAARHYGLFLCVQDLTCPGASLVQSAALAAYVPGVAAVEANARQFVPAANAAWLPRFPGLFRVSGGTVDTSALTGPGLGAVP